MTMTVGEPEGDWIYVKSKYDASGDEVFKSLPSPGSSASIGITKTYDDFGRLKEILKIIQIKFLGERGIGCLCGE